MVSTATVIEGALDILSCATLMELAANDLPPQVNGFVVLFCLLEIFNGCQSFALQALLSGGHDTNPLKLVNFKAKMRAVRGLIDFGCFMLRIILWVRYSAVSSVFLIKNLYNLLHTWVEVDRARGIAQYPKGTLFTEQVHPQEWYGMSLQEWRVETSDTLLLQAQAGRAV
jgi:hypothetical protein